MTGTQPAPSAALLKIMGGTLAQPFFATLLGMTTNQAVGLSPDLNVRGHEGRWLVRCGMHVVRMAPRYYTSAYGPSGACTNASSPLPFPHTLRMRSARF
jgi:hypothetical protein